MVRYRHGAHSVLGIHLHIAWVTKYRWKILQGEVGTRARDLLREICRAHDVETLKAIFRRTMFI
ncbi:MAG: transposase [Planctomycetes bacterium]|nr:transposase [Planctomycetota bacterium]